MRPNVEYEIIDFQKIYGNLYLFYLRFGNDKLFRLLRCFSLPKNKNYNVCFDGILIHFKKRVFSRYCPMRKCIKKKKKLKITEVIFF